MPTNAHTSSLDDERSRWTGLSRADLRTFERAPLDPSVGFAVPDRVANAEAAPIVVTVQAILEVLGDDGVTVGFDGAFDTATVRAIAELAGDDAPSPRPEHATPYLREARLLSEAAGLTQRRMGHYRASALGRGLRDDPGALLPLLLRTWVKRPIGASGRFAKAVHGTWPLALLLLQRFGDEWRAMRFYAALVRVLSPAAVAEAPGYDDAEAADAFVDTFALDVLLGFAGIFGLAEIDGGDDEVEPLIVASPLLFDLLPLAPEQAPAAVAFDHGRWGEDGGRYGGAVGGPSPRPNPARHATDELKAAIGDRTFESKEAFEAFVDAFFTERNAAPIEDFDGLSSSAMTRLLHDPFGDASPLVIADVPRSVPRSSLLHLVLDLADALGDDGLRATERGNLPRAYVLGAVDRFRAAGWHLPDYVQVRNEHDFGALSVARFVARAAGLVTLRNRRWSLTRAYRTTLARSGVAGVYAALFRAFVQKYAWNSADRYADLAIVQTSWAYSLLLLLRYGAEPRDGAYYAERFVRAFPMTLDEAAASLEQRPWSRSPLEYVTHAFELRTFERFAVPLGLVEVERAGEYGLRARSVRATPELAGLVAERSP